MMVYLACPMDFSDGRAEVVDRVIQILNTADCTVFAPCRAWVNGKMEADTVNGANDFTLSNCDAVVAILYPDTNTIGVPMEIQLGLNLGLPVAVLEEGLSKSVALQKVQNRFRYDGSGLYSWLCGLKRLPRGPQVQTALVQRDPIYAEGLPLPAQSKDGDIGCDLTVSRTTVFGPGEWGPVPSDISVLAPKGSWFMIAGRSSALVKRNLHVVSSVIDGGFTGRLYCMAHNLSDKEVTIERGERIAQLLPLPLTRVVFREVDKLPATERGESGFGSTGQ